MATDVPSSDRGAGDPADQQVIDPTRLSRVDPLTPIDPEIELTVLGRLTTASNGTFLCQRTDTADGPEAESFVYKPVAGERPLWDFPDGTLAEREVAAHLLSTVGGFGVVPTTELIEGPMGTGSLQRWVNHGDPSEADRDELIGLTLSREVPDGVFAVMEGLDQFDRPVTVFHQPDDRLRRLALFDVLANNSDRKGAHILSHRDRQGDERVFGIDNGLCFHAEAKLRTVLWGWTDEELTEDESALVTLAMERAPDALAPLLTDAEVEALIERCTELLLAGRFPEPREDWPSVPWPPV